MSDDTAKKIYRMNRASKGVDPDAKEFMTGFYNIQDAIERSDFPNLNLAALVGYFKSVKAHYGAPAQCLETAADTLLKMYPALKGRRSEQAVEVLKRQPESVQITSGITQEIKGKLPKLPKAPEEKTFEE